MTFKSLIYRLSKIDPNTIQNTKVTVLLDVEDLSRMIRNARGPYISLPLDLKQGTGTMKAWFVKKEKKDD